MKNSNSHELVQTSTALLECVLHLADNSLILSQRLSEWCGHGPILEQDIAMTNIALDLIGEARNYYQYAAILSGGDTKEDDLAYFRNDIQFKNALLVELPNGDFGVTILRQFLYDAWHLPFLVALCQSSDETLAAVAEKSRKEAAYHLKWSSEWVIRLGDGTEESKARMIKAVNTLWPYSQELITPIDRELVLKTENIWPNNDDIEKSWKATVSSVFNEAGLEIPELPYYQFGGKTGKHSEHLGYVLAEMQVLQRSMPGLVW